MDDHAYIKSDRMRTWYIAFKASPARSVVTTVQEQGDLGSDAFMRFDAMAKAGTFQGREIFGMWIVEHGNEQEDILRCFGNAPLGYKQRHENWLKRQQ
jgi:hypothetical protein